MENGEVAIEESTTSVEEQMLEAISENEDSQPSDTDGDTIEDAGSDTEEVEAQSEQEDVEEKPKEEVIPKKAFTRRINSLQAAKRKAEGRADQLEQKMSEYDLVLKELKSRLDASEAKLSDYEENDPRDAEIQRLKVEQSMRALRQKNQQESQQKQFVAQQEEIINQRADDIIETARDLSEKFKTFSAEELVISFSKTDDVSLKDLAKNIHNVRVKAYKKHLSKGRSNKPTPAPLRPQGARTSTSGHSSDEMVLFLESLHGDR
tara:strand:+ start:969 stop:1757 length:789 start_codon:yes stop_codon:yes gene_type:complete